MGIGRPTLLTEEIGLLVAKYIRQGNTLRCAAMSVGVSWDTFKLWRRKGEDGTEPYATFCTLTREAEAYAERWNVRAVRRGARLGGEAAQGAKVAQWWLERRRWKDWWRDKSKDAPKDPAGLTNDQLRDALVAELLRLAKREDDVQLLAVLETIKNR